MLWFTLPQSGFFMYFVLGVLPKEDPRLCFKFKIASVFMNVKSKSRNVISIQKFVLLTSACIYVDSLADF